MAVAGGHRPDCTGMESVRSKWPNDIVIHGKKVVRDPDGDECPDGLHVIHIVVSGLASMCNNECFPEEIAQRSPPHFGYESGKRAEPCGDS